MSKEFGKDMKYCPTCGNLLIGLDEGMSARVFACQTCPYRWEIVKRVVKEVVLAKKHVDDVLGDEVWETAQKTTIRCVNCENDTAYFMQIQTRSADEPTTVFYRCTSCAKKWKEG